ncbi:MAG: hypothetical protein R3C19_16300 [Planctomycetaceae bacterium]
MKFRCLVCSVLLLSSVTAALADDAKLVDVDLEGLKLRLPESWEKQESSSRLRLATYKIPAAEGDREAGELAVFGQMGGSVADNLSRWISQFSSEGRESTLTMGEVEGRSYHMANVTGTYQKPDGPPVLRKTVPTPGYAMLAVIIEVEGKGNYFLKLTGPKKTVEAQAEALRKAFGGDADKEEPYEI